MARPALKGLTFLLAAVMVAGCGTTAAPSSSAGSQPGDALPEVVVALAKEPASLDSSRADGEDINLVQHFQQKLVEVDPETLELVPVLAESWSHPEPLVWEIKIRQGIKFSNGDPLTAEAVKASYEWYERPDSTAHRGSQITLDHVEVVDDYTARIVTKEPYPILPARIANDTFIHSPRQIEEAPETMDTNPIGTGPFMVKDWVKGQYVELVPNPEYSDPPEVNLKWRFISEGATRVSELLTGGVDVVFDPPVEQLGQIEDSGDATIVSVPGTRRRFIEINVNEHEAFKDKRVRQAINYAVDRQSICDNILGGLCQLMAGITNPPNADPDLEPYPYDPEKAKQLLAEAGYGDGIKDVEINTKATDPKDLETYQAIAQQLTAVGIETTVNVMDAATYDEHLTNHTFTDLVETSMASFYDPVSDFQYLQPEYRFNLTGWVPPEIEKIFNESYSNPDPEARAAAGIEMGKLAYEEAPWLFLWRLDQLWAVSDRIEGYVASKDLKIFLDQVRVVEGS